MNILVTGGAGFIGSHIADALIDEGHQVTIIDNLSTGRRENMPAEARFIELDIRDSKLESIFKDTHFDAVYHQAAQGDLRISVRDPVEDLQINIAGSVNLLVLCEKYKVDHFLFASTGGAIYGEQETFPAPEAHPANPVSPYGVAKLAVEKYMFFFHSQYGLNTTALRYANVYGPRQNPFGEAGVIAIFCHKMLSGEQPYINGDGLQTRDYVYVGDVVRANLSALALEGYNIINIGTRRETDVVTIFDILRKLTGSKCERKHKPEAPGEQRRSVIDPSLAARLIDWRSEVEFEEGLELTVDYFRKTCS